MAMLTLVVSAVVASGCYTFQPVRQASPGDQIRARLTIEEAIRQSQDRDTPIRVLDGTVRRSESDRIDLEVVTARGQTLQENFQFATSYSIPLTGIEEMSLRKLNPVKTGALLATLAAGLYLILDATVIDGGLFGSARPIDVDPAEPITPFKPVR